MIRRSRQFSLSLGRSASGRPLQLMLTLFQEPGPVRSEIIPLAQSRSSRSYCEEIPFRSINIGRLRRRLNIIQAALAIRKNLAVAKVRGKCRKQDQTMEK